MVKFSKELEAQLIPEWKDAFINYWQLKKHIKRIKISRKPRQRPSQGGDCGRSILDPIRLISQQIADKFRRSENNIEIIKVRKKDMKEGDDEVYQTDLIQFFSHEEEMKVFFEVLDDELNKVNKFYKAKESEFIERGEVLNKQLEILLELKQILSDRRWKQPDLVARCHSWSSCSRSSRFPESPLELVDCASDTASQTDEVIVALERNGVSFINSATRNKTKKEKPKMAMRIDIPSTNPSRLFQPSHQCCGKIQ